MLPEQKKHAASGASPSRAHRSEGRKQARPLAPLFMIWGLQQLLTAVIGFFAVYDAVRSYQQAIYWAAGAATLLWIIAQRDKLSAKTIRALWLASAIILTAEAVLIVLQFTQIVGRSFQPLASSLALSVMYFLWSRQLGKPLIWLGAWLFAASILIAYRFLGFAPLLAGGFSGLSLLTLGGWIHHWNRKGKIRS